ncbi:hypothetical protein AALP_AAs58509U000100, partial [Arabis alpina]
ISPLLLKCDGSDMMEDAGMAEVVRKLDQACRDIGFFYVIGHGISEDLLNKVKDVSHQFFELPYEEKLKINISPATGYRPENPQGYKELMNEYIKLCTALGGSPYEFEGKMVGDPFWEMRIIGYPGVKSENEIGCGAHTDYSLLTLINQDDDKTALQVRDLAGDWISAIPIPGSFICNIGDMLKILSNGVCESTLHRVINNSPRYRVCVAFFYEPNFDGMVEPLDIFKEKYPGIKRSQVFKRLDYGEYLVNKVQTTFANLVEHN